MTVMALDYVQAPAGTPARFGILSAAVVVEDNNPHAGFGYEYNPDFCGPARMTAALCLDSTPKTADGGVNITEGQPFAVYALASCNNVGTDTDFRARAARSLTTGEGRAVEEWLGQRLEAEADDQGGTWIESTPLDALAAAEHYIHCNYGGVGTIHMNRGTATGLLAQQALVVSGDRLLTQLGNLVSAGCYQVGGGDAIYATGTVMLRRGPVFQPPDRVFDQASNEQFALAERPYAGSWECFAIKVNVGTGP